MIEQVTPGALPDWLRTATVDGVPPLLLDVREPPEWQAASVRPAGAELLLMPMHNIPARVADLDPDRPVAVLCHHGGRSMQVAMFLAQHGFERVDNVAGGIDAWSRDVDPSVPRY